MSGDPTIRREIVSCDGNASPACAYWGPHAHYGRAIPDDKPKWFVMSKSENAAGGDL